MTLRETDNPPMCFPEDILTRNLVQDILWYVVHTKPRQEKVLAWNLKEIGINYYLPLAKQEQKSKNRLRFSVIPLFTGYLFFRGNLSQRIGALKTNRIVRIMDVSDQNLLINELNIIHAAIINRRVGVYNSKIQNGIKVRIVDGPLKGTEGIVLQKKNNKEVIIHIESIHQSLRIDIESDKIEVI